MDLLRERGIYATRVEDITERADVGKGVFYNYFESKDALVADIVAEAGDVFARDYLVPLANEESLEQRITALIGAHQAFFKDHPEYAMVFHQARGLLMINDDGSLNLRNALLEGLHRLTGWLTSSEESDAWSSEDRLDVAAVVSGAMAGYRSFCIAMGRPVRAETLRRILTQGIPGVLAERREAETPKRRSKQAR
jgi:AcrR family transcriptional regulator